MSVLISRTASAAAAVLLLVASAPLYAATTAYFTLCCDVPSSVSVLNSQNLMQIRSFPVGLQGSAIVLNGAGTTAYVANNVSSSVSVVDIASGAIAFTVPIPISSQAGPIGLAISPDGRYVYAFALFATPSSTIYQIDTLSDQITGSVAFAGSGFFPATVLVSPDGTQLYASAGSSTQYLQVINAATMTLGSQIPVNQFADGLGITPSGKVLWTDAANELVVIDPKAGVVLNRFALPSEGLDQPGPVTSSADSSQAYLTFQGPSILAVNLSDGSTAFQVATTGVASALVVSPDGSKLYTADTQAAISVIDLTAHTLLQTVNQPASTAALAVSPDGKTVYAVNQANSAVATVTASNGQLTSLLPSGTGLAAVAVEPNGVAWVSNPFAGVSAGVDSLVNPLSHAFKMNVPAPGGYLTLTPNGAKLFVSTGNEVYVLDTKTGQKLGTIPYGGLQSCGPTVVAPDGHTLYVSVSYISGKTVFAPGYISVVDTSSYSKLTAIAINDGMGAMTLTPDGTTLLVTANQGRVHEISTVTNKIFATVQISPANTAYLASIAVTPDDLKAYVVDQANQAVDEVDLLSNQQIASIAVGKSPSQIVITLDGSEAYILRPKSVEVLNLSTNQLSGVLVLPYPATAVAFH